MDMYPLQKSLVASEPVTGSFHGLLAEAPILPSGAWEATRE